MIPFRIGLLGLLIAVLGVGCTTSRPYVSPAERDWAEISPPPDAERVYRVFLIGDAGAPVVGDRDPLLADLGQAFRDAGERSAVVFLGDNIYCCGLPDSAAAEREFYEARLQTQLDAVKDGTGRIFVIPGNHDWNDGRPGGQARVANQEAYVEAYLDRGNTFVPDRGFPGPVEIELEEGLVLVLIDTQWWLHPHEKPYGDTGEYDLEEDGNFLLQMEDVVLRYDDERLLVVGHHPLVSNGSHAGFMPLKTHLFPLTKLKPWLYLPLPVLGSAYPLYVRFFGGRQDLAHPRYRSLRTGLTRLFEAHESLVYASGHEHNLQHHPIGLQHYIVSGAGARPSPVARGRGTSFVSGTYGYMVLDYYEDGQLWMAAHVLDERVAGAELYLAFRKQLFGVNRELVDPGLPTSKRAYPDYRDSTVTVAANPDYLAGSLKRFILGSHNREAWGVPVEVPVLDLGRTAGGLTPVKRGGGMQTTSLRLEGADGKEYVLRSIDKDPSKTVPEPLQGTIATDIVQDQIASIHPYGAFVIPKLAEAAGVYHTQPRLVWVPDDPRLGIYRASFGNRLMMFEDRPDDDMSDLARYGNSEEVISATDLYEEINDDNDHRVDQRAFVRARLFDILLSDWDRHRDQWRWASFEPYELDPTLEGDARTQGKIYRPIPRDRDWAFNRMNGLVSAIRFVDPKFQEFTEDYGYVPGLIFNGLEQDRRLSAEVTRAEWIALAEDLQARLTDSVIDEALRDWPASIYELDAERVARVLKVRRDELDEAAAEYYAILARVVDVVGSNKHERFQVDVRPDGTTEVTVDKTKKDGEVEKQIYARVFDPAETKEIRLYGLDGNDQFFVRGSARDPIRITIVGGEGEDRLEEEANGPGGRFVHMYDTIEENTWAPGPHTRVYASSDPLVNVYDPWEYQYDSRLPLVFFGSNQDDGLFIGGGLSIVRRGFRKDPYAANHRIKANVAAKTLAFNVVYQGHYVEALGRWDAGLDATVLAPGNIRNFYGLGNQTSPTVADAQFYQARLAQLRLAPRGIRRIGEGLRVEVGPTMQFTRIRQDDDRFIAQPQAGVAETTFDDQWIVGAEARLDLSTVDDPINPRQGFSLTGAADVNQGVRNSDASFSTLRGALTLYTSPLREPQVTLALRAGGAHNIGAFPFYAANTLGERDNLRGYRSTRFAGRSSFYTNAELRLQLFTFSTYLAIGRFGVLGFVDNGRVWTEEDDGTGVSQSFWNGYHQGYGGGVWATLFDLVVLNATIGASEEQTTFKLDLGFMY